MSPEVPHPGQSDAEHPTGHGRFDQEPWWRSGPTEPPVDSVLVEGVKLASALRDWAVESGAVSALADLTQSAASSASAYLSGGIASESVTPADAASAQPVVRCSDCPVCQGLDALERSNPQMAHTARATLSQISTMVAGLISASGHGKVND
jgi:hypothetical protein